MSFNSFTLIGVTALAGLLYGFIFLLQQKNLFSSSAYSNRLQQIGYFILRLVLLVFIGHYLLRSAFIPSILGTITFFGMFWLMVIMIKARIYERI